MARSHARLSRRSFLAQSSALAVGAAAARPSFALAGGDGPLQIGSEPQLLIDDWIIESSEGLKRTLHQPQKQGLIKEADGRDFERGGVYVGKIVCRDENSSATPGRFHMTYRYYWWDPSLERIPAIGIDKAHWFHESTGYATSEDGVHWHKPNLGRFEAPSRFRQSEEFPFELPEAMSTDNNLGCPVEFAYDLHLNGNITDPDKRFLLNVVERRDGTHPFAKPLDSQMYFASHWPDFASDPRWKEQLLPVAQGKLSPRGSQTICGYDHDVGEWFMTCQDLIGNWLKHDGRNIARYSSPDLVSWAGPELVLPVPEDESREPKDWVEYMDLWAKRVGGRQSGAWLGQLVVFHGDRSKPEYQMPTIPNVWRKGTTEVRLVISRDAGRTWHRVGDKQAWLPHHLDDDGFDRLVFAGNIVPVGDEYWIYYSAWDGDHLVFFHNGDTYYPHRLRNNSTAWAKLRVDGYVSLDAGTPHGSLLTRPLQFEGDKLVVNLEAPKGRLQAELVDPAGRPYSGFAMTDCEPVTGDGVELAVRWKGDGNLKKLAGTPIRIRFQLTDASLYSFRFA
jgi:hypothetical protein